ncbi:MAG: hypothetical protein ABL983_03555 [Nitrospira sp.]
MNIIPSLREQLGDALVSVKDSRQDLKWMADAVFVALVVNALHTHLNQQRPSPPKE